MFLQLYTSEILDVSRSEFCSGLNYNPSLKLGTSCSKRLENVS